MPSTTSMTHPRPNPTPAKGIRQVDYVGRHRAPEPDTTPSLWVRALRAIGVQR